MNGGATHKGWFKWLFVVMVFIVGCNVQKRNIARLHKLNHEYKSELAKDCAECFPVTDSIGKPIYIKADNKDYTKQIDSLQSKSDSLSKLIATMPVDSQKYKQVIQSLQGSIFGLNKKIIDLKASYKPCKPDTIKVFEYKKDIAELTVWQNKYITKSDSLITVKTQLKQAKESKAWYKKWLLITWIGEGVILLIIIVIWAYRFFSGGAIVGEVKKII